MFTKTVLDNGIRILSEERQNARSVSLGFWVENGSRHESSHQNGISHFIEHLFFKGTESRCAAQIAEEMDAVGGVLNAFTGKEYTCYYAKVLDENLPLAIDLLTDIFLHSVFDLFNLDYFKDHSLGRPICGRAETVSSFQREDFLSFVHNRYLPGRLIIAAAGHLSHEELVGEIDRKLGGKNLESRNQSLEFKLGDLPKPQGGVFLHSKPMEQVHLCFGVAGIHQSHRLRYAAYILNTILGGGMSSRLFQEIREKRGRAYSVYSFLAPFTDVGYLGIYAGTSLEWVEEVADLILKEMRRLTEGEIREEELQRTKSQLVGNTILGLESTDSWMSHITRNEIYFGKAVSVEEISQEIRSVSLSDVTNLAREIFRPEGLVVSLLGDLKDGFKLQSLEVKN